MQLCKWLVLLDCGGTKKKASKKMSAKKRQISQLVDNGCFSGWKVTVLLFIPAAPSETKTSSTSLSDDVDIAIVAGSLATEWLGSWSQLRQYLPDEADPHEGLPVPRQRMGPYVSQGQLPSVQCLCEASPRTRQKTVSLSGQHFVADAVTWILFAQNVM